MDEGRKRAILIAASILVSRKFAQLGAQSSPALEAAISDAESADDFERELSVEESNVTVENSFSTG
jgi:hypothetical protein